MRQISASQAKGGSPFLIRARLVCSKARFSMSFGSTGAGVVDGLTAIGLTEVISLASCARAGAASNMRRIPAMGSRRDIATSRVPNAANRVQHNYPAEFEVLLDR